MDKVYPSAEEALKGIIADGQTIAVGGFGLCGIPEALIQALRSGTLDDDFPKPRNGIIGGVVNTRHSSGGPARYSGVASAGQVFLSSFGTTATVSSHAKIRLQISEGCSTPRNTVDDLSFGDGITDTDIHVAIIALA